MACMQDTGANSTGASHNEHNLIIIAQRSGDSVSLLPRTQTSTHHQYACRGALCTKFTLILSTTCIYA
jgi:hypothetical protein